MFNQKRKKTSDDEKYLENLLFDKPKNVLHNDKPVDIATLSPSIYSNEAASNEAVWNDDDDVNLQIDLNSVNRLKKFKQTINDESTTVDSKTFSILLSNRYQPKQLKWSQIPVVQNKEENELDLLCQSGSFIEKGVNSSSNLPLAQDDIDIMRMKDANHVEPSTGVISVTKFNSVGDILMVAGDDKYLRLFRIDGDKNDKLISTKFPSLLNLNADFLSNNSNQSNEIILCGGVPYFYSYDISTGSIIKIPGFRNRTGLCKFDKMAVSPDSSTIAFSGLSGYGHIYNSKQKTLMFDIKMNSEITALNYIDNTTLITSNNRSEVYLWDVRYTNKFLSKFTHDDGTATTAIAGYSLEQSHFNNYSNNNKSTYTNNGLIAVGADSGVVSLYNSKCSEKGNSANYSNQKLKSFMNILTPIKGLKFHPSGEILAIASNDKRNQLRLVHISSGCIYNNWPDLHSPLGRVQSFDFSPGGGYFAIGNNNGNVLLYRLKHYMSS